MSVAPSRARSRSRAPSNARGPIVVELPPKSPRAPMVVDLPPPTPRAVSRARSRSVGRAGPLAVDAPGLSGGRGMFKRLIVACDGTWLNSDNGMVNGKLAVPSNVTRLSRAIKAVSQDGVPQIVNYHFGVGTQGSKINRFISGTVGEGLADNVREAYSFLANNYHPGDEIFLFGFSRGAFTARSIAGLIDQVGLLTKKGLHTLPEVFEDVQRRRDPRYVPKNPDIPFPRKMNASDPRYAEELERRGLTRLDIPVKAIGVWDTVGSLGTPRIGWLTKVGLQSNESKEMSFYDTKLSTCVENAFQALALDERRGAFSPAVWEKPEGSRTMLRQVWFPGVHSNVGGGYDDQQLANISLAWMMSQLEPFLDMREEYLFEQDAENDKFYRKDRQEVRPWGWGEIVNSNTGLYALAGSATRTPGFYHAVDPHTCRPLDRPLKHTCEYIHPSVRARIRLQGPGVADKGYYDCRALTDNYKLVVDYGANMSKNSSAEPEIFWKLKFRDADGAKVLREAPLWRLERELCRKDPQTYEYVKRPPATSSGSSKRRRSGRPPSADFPQSPASPSGRFATRKSFPAERDSRDRDRDRDRERGGPRSSTVLDKRDRMRSRSRARSLDRETEIRDEMPHRRERDRAWWEGVSGVGSGARSPRGPDPMGGRSPRRSSMRV